MKILQPPGWTQPKGYANGIAVKGGTTVFIAGQLAFNSKNVIEEKTFAGQFRQTLRNTLAVLAEAGAKPEHIVRMTWYLVDRGEYIARAREIGAAFRDAIGSYAIAMTAVEVSALIEARAKVEIEVTAVIP